MHCHLPAHVLQVGRATGADADRSRLLQSRRGGASRRQARMGNIWDGRAGDFELAVCRTFTITLRRRTERKLPSHVRRKEREKTIGLLHQVVEHSVRFRTGRFARDLEVAFGSKNSFAHTAAVRIRETVLGYFVYGTHHVA